MKKTSRKLISAALLSAVLLAAVSCGGESQTPADTTGAGQEKQTETAVETEKVIPHDELPEIDMNGWELSVFNCSADSLTWANLMLDVKEESGDILNDALFYRNRKLNERFNMNLRMGEEHFGYISTLLGKQVMAGENEYDIFVMSETEPLTGFLPYIMDWSEIPYLQLDQPWWNPDATSVYHISGKQTALAGNMTLTALSRAVCMAFNKKIWSVYGDADINLYDLVNRNQWTVDKFLEISQSVHRDLNGDGTMNASDLYGLNMGRGFKGYIASFLAGSGMNFTEKNASGEDVFTLHENERGLNLMIRLVDALGAEGYYYNEDESVNGVTPSDLFKNGHTLFTQAVPNDIYKLRDMDDDIGILPMPKYDAAQKKYYSAAWGGAVWTLAKTFDTANKDNLGIALEAMSFDTYYNVVPVYKEVALKAKSTRDNESEAMLDIIYDSIYFDFGTNLMYDAIISKTFLTTIWNKKSSDVIVSSIEEVLPQMQKYIRDLNEQTAEME